MTVAFCVLLHSMNLTEWCQIAMCDFSMDNKQSYLIFFSSVSRQSCALEGESHPHDRWVLHLRNIAFLDQSPPLCDHRASSSSLSTRSASTKRWEKGSLASCSRLFGPRRMEARYRNPRGNVRSRLVLFSVSLNDRWVRIISSAFMSLQTHYFGAPVSSKCFVWRLKCSDLDFFGLICL